MIMLRLMDVQLSGTTYVVTLDRDGKTHRYDFDMQPSPNAEKPPYLVVPEQADWDLIDYEWKPPPGRPHGAIWIPALDEVVRIVHRISEGEQVEFPVVLDER